MVRAALLYRQRRPFLNAFASRTARRAFASPSSVLGSFTFAGSITGVSGGASAMFVASSTPVWRGFVLGGAVPARLIGCATGRICGVSPGIFSQVEVVRLLDGV